MLDDHRLYDVLRDPAALTDFREGKTETYEGALLVKGSTLKGFIAYYRANPSTTEGCFKTFEKFERQAFSNRLILDEEWRLWILDDKVVLRHILDSIYGIKPRKTWLLRGGDVSRTIAMITAEARKYIKHQSKGSQNE